MVHDTAGRPQRALLTVDGLPGTMASDPVTGRFYRPLAPGTYTVRLQQQQQQAHGQGGASPSPAWWQVVVPETLEGVALVVQLPLPAQGASAVPADKGQQPVLQPQKQEQQKQQVHKQEQQYHAAGGLLSRLFGGGGSQGAASGGSWRSRLRQGGTASAVSLDGSRSMEQQPEQHPPGEGGSAGTSTRQGYGFEPPSIQWPRVAQGIAGMVAMQAVVMTLVLARRRRMGSGGRGASGGGLSSASGGGSGSAGGALGTATHAPAEELLDSHPPVSTVLLMAHGTTKRHSPGSSPRKEQPHGERA